MQRELKNWARFFQKRIERLFSYSCTPRQYKLPPEFAHEKGQEEKKPASSSFESGSKLYVVWDALGDGRLVGVFSSEEKMRKILAINPYYYRFYVCEPELPTLTAIDWLEEKPQDKLLQICKSTKKSLRY